MKKYLNRSPRFAGRDFYSTDEDVEAAEPIVDSKTNDGPPPYFPFSPLVPRERDAFRHLKRTALRLAHVERKVRSVPITVELYDLIVFLTQSFVRPMISELYALRHSDVTVADNPKRLILRIRVGKTGYRFTNTLKLAVDVYKRILRRQPNYQSEDFLFFPRYANRATAVKIAQRQFRALLEEAGLEEDIVSGTAYTLYSLRHTAICMRLVLSEGRVNIFNLAKNAGTSVDQIQRFYARNLPLSAEKARNLPSKDERFR